MEYKNILYSTTRQYNPGDEFILFGVRNLLRGFGIKENPVIFNRNQEINQPLSFLNPLRRIRGQSKWIKVLGSFLRISQVDNSFKDIHALDIYDMVVFAGSPEWASSRLTPLYRKLEQFEGPILYLGVGSFGQRITLSRQKYNILKRAALITYRNPELDDFFSAFDQAEYLPCPALFSVEGMDHELQKGSLAIVFGITAASKGNHVSDEAMMKMIAAYEHFSKRGYQVDVVCHYIDEIPYAKTIFPNAEIRYSYDARDYEAIYAKYEYVITSRVHAIGICASLGIPGTLIAHDGRASTAVQFKAEIVRDDLPEATFFAAVEQRLEKTDQLSAELRRHKAESFENYQQLLRNAIGEIR